MPMLFQYKLLEETLQGSGRGDPGRFIARSSSGRTLAFGAENGGSNPPRATGPFGWADLYLSQRINRLVWK